MVKRNDTTYLCCEGRIKSYEDYLAFAKGLDDLIAQHIALESSPKQWKIMLLDTFPINSYALGHLLRLKLYNHYDFALATNNYRVLETLEIVEFHNLFTLSVEHDPRYTKAKDLKEAQSPQNPKDATDPKSPNNTANTPDQPHTKTIIKDTHANI